MTWVRGMPEVGPVGDSYAYRVGGHLSSRRYANAASARFDGRRLQHVRDDGTAEPWDTRPEYTLWAGGNDDEL